MAIAKLTPVIDSLTGKIGPLTFRKVDNQTIVSTSPQKWNYSPNEDRQKSRETLIAATKLWDELHEENRDNWEEYAKEFGHLVPARPGSTPNGRRLFIKATTHLFASEKRPRKDPPQQPPQQAILSLSNVRIAGTGISFHVQHDLPSEFQDYTINVKSTGSTGSTSRKPIRL